MNPDQARTLISQTFTRAFEKGRFLNFIRNLLNHLDESKAFARNAQYIKDAFKDHVNRFERLGSYTSPKSEKLDVLVVHLTEEWKLQRARTAIRNFVADHLKLRNEKEAALVAFVSPTEKQWRFSYVKMEYSAVEQGSGGVAVETRLTPARRFSYIVGEGESCHTAQARFVDLLKDTPTDPSLGEIEEAFSVEAVTTEFFKKYARLFGEIHKALEKLPDKDETIREEFKDKNVNPVDFAKKLMGQIVFLYFLQKKGWLGVAKGQDWGTGPHDFLRRLQKGGYGKYDNFFNDILEPLFYDTLATDRGHEAWCDRFKCRIPFLNGGLFEPLGNYDWRRTDILLPNGLFSNSESVEEGITGTGVLDVFDRYNFTVNEAEPLEKEVAIDPEMLGKVFENLIEENRRKGLGAYYTPREIVHYMCQQSLVKYLDASLNKGEEVVSPKDIATFVDLGEQAALYEAARLSGTKGYDVHLPKAVEQHARLIDDKLAEIRICDPAVGSGAFPVGMMIEIVRARSALTPYFNDFQDRTPYHFKLHAIQNCLYGVDIDVGAVEIARLRLWLSLVVDEEEVKRIKPLPNLDFKIVAGNSLLRFPYKTKGLEEVEKLKPAFFEETNHVAKAKLREQIEGKLSECFAMSKTTFGYEVNFDFHVTFSEVFHSKVGFDVCIANPPYGAKFTAQEKRVFERLYLHQDYQIDSYLLFLERAFDLLDANGVLAFIIPNPWLTNLTLKNIRRFVFQNHTVYEIAHYSKKVFEAVVDTEVVIIKNGSCAGNRVLVRIIQERDSIVSQQVDQKRWASLDGEPINIFARGEDEKLIEKLKTNSVPLSEVCTVSNGMKPYEIGKGIPSQTKAMVSRRVYDASHRKDQSYRPLLRGRDIQKYVNKWDGNRWIKYGENLAAPRSAAQFDAPEKIVIRQTGDSLIATIDRRQFVCMNNMHTIVTKENGYDLLFVLGLLNSRLLNYYFQWLNPEKGEALAEVKKEHVEKLVVKKASAKQKEPIISTVKRIIAAKERDPDADTTEWEHEVDRLVYELYGLTPDEIKLVEGSTR